jgi:hypothetical protein
MIGSHIRRNHEHPITARALGLMQR